ncbi:MAG: fatty acid desaturase family protein [Sphaerospermopsis kisseleviana]
MKDFALGLNINQALRSSVADLGQVNPWLGLCRFSVLGALFLSLITLAWRLESLIWFSLVTAIAGIVYAFWLICTHDSTHNTLTGWGWFEAICPRLISWPMLWPYGTYAELHLLHHGWNGVDLRDPERVEWTLEEYQQAGPFLRWYVRHQWLIDLFILGGLGLIVKTLRQGIRQNSLRTGLRGQIAGDLGGMMLIQGLFGTIALSQGLLGRYLLFWLLLERMIGIIVQMRDHLEHYGRWGQGEGHLLTQLYASRNLPVNRLTNWLMGGLPYHSVHHGFPQLPFNQLPEAFGRIQAVLQAYNLPPMELGQGYLRETLVLSQHPTVWDGQLNIPL